MESPEQEIDDEPVHVWTLLIQTLLITVALVGGVALAGYFFRAEFTGFAVWLVDTLGLWGVFVGIILTDAFTFPVPPDTYLLVTVASDAEVGQMLLICCAGSIFAGNLAYQIGPYIARVPIFKKRIERFRGKGEYLFEKWGGWTVVIAALTPIPFSVVCWFARIYNMPRGKFFLATFARVPRLVGYYYLFELGWSPL